MRSLEECKAEIFRRSEEKIKKRKQQRNRILAICLPLCLCIGAFALWGSGQDDRITNKSTAENGLGLLFAPMEEAAVEDVNMMNPALLDREEITSQYEFVQSLFLYGMDTEEPPYEIKGPDISATSGAFQFSLTAPDGTLISYTLTGNTLCEDTTGRFVTLTDAQLRELKQVLDIQEVAE